MRNNNNEPLMATTETNGQLIPRYVGSFTSEEKSPPVIGIDSDSMVTKAERRVCDFFKCCNNWDLSDGLNGLKKCYATRNTTLNFEIHLKERHYSEDLFCVYCYELNNKSPTKKYSIHRYLIKHMVKRHRFRRVQCGSCLYRALTVEHVIIHQKLVHESLYKKAISNSDNSDGDGCKIFVCQPIFEDEGYPKLDHYYRKYKTERMNSTGNENQVQCLYCTFMNQQLSKVIEHCVEKHADYPLLYYLPENRMSSSAYSQLASDFINLDGIQIRTKFEPQDNSVSSTEDLHQKTAVASDLLSKKRVRESSPEENSVESQPINKKRKRMSVCESASSSSHSGYSLQSSTQSKICFFCEQVYPDSESARNHMQSYFNKLQDMPRVSKWIDSFIKSQLRLAFFEDNARLDPRKAYYYCPLCIRLSKNCNKRPKYYETLNGVLNHFWDHCSWFSVKCKKCEIYIYDNDTVIANHFRDNHDKQIKSKYSYLRDSDVSFTDEQRTNLEKKFIETHSNTIIESQIEKLVKEIKSEREKQLIDKCYSLKSFVVTSKMSDTQFKKHIKLYEDYEKRKNMKKDKSSDSDATKRNDVFTGGQSSSKTNENSNKSNDGNDLTTDLLNRISGVKKDLGPNTSSPDFDQTSGRNDDNLLLSPESNETEGNKDKDQELESDNALEEENNRISCYHCNDKFRDKKEFYAHHQRQHPNLVRRMFAKEKQKHS